MTITESTANLCMDAMAFSLTKTLMAVTPDAAENIDELAQQIETIIRGHFVQFCEMMGIDNIEEEDEPYFPDDVDETNYDPYMGCDFFETCDCDEGW